MTNTFVFSTNADFDTQSGPLALGVGEQVQDAQADALARLAKRHSKEALRSDERLHALQQALAWGLAPPIHRVEGPYPTQDEMGHTYMSFASEAAATAFASDEAVARLVANENLLSKSPSALRTALRPLLHRFLNTFTPRELIDWHEVQAEFATHAEQERMPREAPIGQDSSSPLADVPARRIDADVLEILRRCVVEGDRVLLPKQHLDRGLYDRVNAVLLALGGRWVGRKVQAHVFSEDPSAALDVAIGTASFTRPQDFGYFPTPAPLVEMLMQRAGIQAGMRVLEPSAGHGAIALQAALAAGDRGLVTVVELLPRNVRSLQDAGFSDVLAQDFLSLEPTPIYDVVCMNPPFGKLADIDHVLHAARFLKPTGRLVAITSPSWLFNGARKAEAFRSFVDEAQGDVVDIAPGAFAASGTQAATRMITMDACNFPWNREALQEPEPVARPRMRA